LTVKENRGESKNFLLISWISLAFQNHIIFSWNLQCYQKSKFRKFFLSLNETFLLKPPDLLLLRTTMFSTEKLLLRFYRCKFTDTIFQLYSATLLQLYSFTSLQMFTGSSTAINNSNSFTIALTKVWQWVL